MIPRYRSPFGVAEVLRAAFWGMHRSELGSIPGIPRRRFLRLAPSASDALHVALRGFGPSGRVVLPAYTCFRVIEAIRSAGWSPVYVDINPVNGEMDPLELADLLSVNASPTVVLATHLHGIPTSISALREVAVPTGARIIEDCAMAQGAMHAGAVVGSFGDAAIFSFGLGKVLSAGAGGALASDTPLVTKPEAAADVSWTSLFELFSRAGFVGDARFHLQEATKHGRRLVSSLPAPKEPGFEPAHWNNIAKSTLARLVCRKSLDALLELQRQRSERWYRFLMSLAGGSITTFRVAPGDRHCYRGLPILADDRDGLQRALRARGIDTARFFDYCAATRDGARGSFPHSEEISRKILVLPLDNAINAKRAEIGCRPFSPLSLWPFSIERRSSLAVISDFTSIA